MAQAGFTPIQLYRTTTASAQPSAGNLADGELAINLTDKKLYAKDASNNVYVLADASSGGTTATNLAGGAAGSLPYQTGANATTFLGIGTAAQVLQVNSGATAPEWVNTSGTGDVARTTSPSFTTPSLGAATALSINSLTLTTSTGTFTLANGKTLTVNNSLTLNGTDATTMTFPSTSATIARTDAAQTFTGTQTVQAAATQDAVALAGRAGGTSSYVSTLTPTTLSASRTVTLPDADTTVPVATQVLTFTGPTAGRTITLPDANFTVARSDAAQSFTGTQTFLSNPVLDAGTANGVLYLDGSKVVTSGSALTFDGATLGVNGVSVGRGAGAVSTNTAVGASALAANTSGVANTVVGSEAGLNNTTANELTAFGRLAARNNTTGNYNTAVGSQAGYSTTTGANNTSIGQAALYSNTTASNNTAVGYQAGYSNTTGTENVFVGISAGRSTTTGSSNVAVGKEAAYEMTTNGAATAIGTNALRNATGTTNTAVGFLSGQAITTGAKNTILGSYDGNQGGLDIRTGSNYVVLSDGDGNCPIFTGNGLNIALQGAGGPAAGTGIQFPATQNASSNANTLDDYEQGTFTPTVGGTWTTSPTSLNGTYVKIGRQVYITVIFQGAAAKATAVSGWIDSLPFSVVAEGTGSVSDNAVGNAGNVLFANSTRMWLTANSFIVGANYFSGTYLAAD